MTGTTQVFEVSAAYQLLVLAAALDSGAFSRTDRRILLTSRNSAQPETASRFEEDPALASLLARFDAVRSYNDLIAPLHPKGFRPKADELPLWERAFRRELGIPLDDHVELALESIQTPPARSILTVFGTSSATVYAEGLMSYGPTRDPLPPRMANRIERVLHLDLVPGLSPMLLAEYGVPTEIVDGDAFRSVVAELAGAPAGTTRGAHALLLGQYLAPLGLLSARAEAALYGDLVESAAASGFSEVVYKPHPSAPASYAEALTERAERCGAHLTVERDQRPAEVFYASDPPGLVLGCFSTGLVTAQRFWNIPTLCIGTRSVLDALPLFEDSNRIPLVLVDLTVPRLEHSVVQSPAATDLSAVLLAVGYAMQWQAHAPSRSAAAAILRDRTSPARDFVPRARLDALRLPGGNRPPLDEAAFRRFVVRQERLTEVRAVGASAARRITALARR